MSEEHLALRLRAAVAHEAATAADDGLAERLLRRTSRSRSRHAAAVAVATLALVGAAVAGTSWLVGAGDTLTSNDTAGAPGPSRLSVQEAGAVTAAQAEREGVDGTAVCQSDAVTAPPPDGAGVAPGLSLYAAYLTDADGYEHWSAEYSGAYGASWSGQTASRALLAICWFTGDVPDDESVGRPSVALTHQIVVVQVSGPDNLAGLRLDVRSPRPLPVVAPRPPAEPPAGATIRSFSQPAGVSVVDELPPRPEPSPVEPVDCTPTACADPNEEVIVRAETRLDGQPLDPRGSRELTAGQTVALELSLDVEEGQAISDVHFALSDGGIGAGPDGPLGLGEVLLREASVSGSRTFDVTWTVPDLSQEQQLVLYYRSEKYQPGEAHTRTLGGVTVS